MPTWLPMVFRLIAATGLAFVAIRWWNAPQPWQLVVVPLVAFFAAMVLAFPEQMADALESLQESQSVRGSLDEFWIKDEALFALLGITLLGWSCYKAAGW